MGHQHGISSEMPQKTSKDQSTSLTGEVSCLAKKDGRAKQRYTFVNTWSLLNILLMHYLTFFHL
jgi:hypothetical protein